MADETVFSLDHKTDRIVLSNPVTSVTQYDYRDEPPNKERTVDFGGGLIVTSDASWLRVDLPRSQSTWRYGCVGLNNPMTWLKLDVYDEATDAALDAEYGPQIY